MRGFNHGFAEGVRINNSRNLEFDLQWNYRLARESEKRAIAIISFLLCNVATCFAQQEIKVNPARVNVYSQGATTVFPFSRSF